MQALIVLLIILGVLLWRLKVNTDNGSRRAVFYAVLCLVVAILLAGIHW